MLISAKGFQPLQMNWGRLIMDAVFRGGDKHSNDGHTVEQMIRHMAALIRKIYRIDVPIIIRMDSGFFDQKIFELCEELNLGYVCGGKLYKDITAMAAKIDEGQCHRFSSTKNKPGTISNLAPGGAIGNAFEERFTVV